MSEPIELYNANGDTVMMYSPRVAAGLVETGELFDCPPVAVESAFPQPKPRTVRKKKEEE